MNRSYLPSKKIWILVGAILALAGLVYLASSNLQSEYGSSLLATVEEKKELDVADADNDGLSDWEESLWGTDPDNPDSDGDGTKDGDEVNENRDPNDSSQDDSLPTLDDSDLSLNTNTTAAINSQAVPQALILATVQAEGENISQDDIRRIANSLEENVRINVRNYSSSELQINSSNSKEAVQTYIENLLSSLSTQTAQQRDPLAVLAVEIQDEQDDVINLSSYISQTQKAKDALLKMSVPKLYVDDHLIILNSASKALSALQAMERMRTDPIVGIAGVQLYKEALEASEAAGARIADQVNQDLQ